MLEDRKQRHREFWEGRGPGLILIPPRETVLYDLRDYPKRFRDPRAMWESEMARAWEGIDWPTDGIPTIRPNLGVTFVPSLAAQEVRVEEGSMPWPGTPLDKETLRAARRIEPATGEMMRLALEFYRIHRDSGVTGVAAYPPDTQGVFDIAHLLYGDEIFLDLADPESADWIRELMEVSFHLYEQATRTVKNALGEPSGECLHGHGTPQGVFFPCAGVRIAEDTASLISPAMIQAVIVPSVERCCQAFDGVFLHFCGHHETLFRQLAALPGVKAIDLGNPERYALDDLMRWCAQTGTVLFSRLPSKPGEDWRRYLERIANAARSAGARVILRPTLFPETREECQEMQETWHRLTQPDPAARHPTTPPETTP